MVVPHGGSSFPLDTARTHFHNCLFCLILTSKEIGEEIEGQVSGKLVYISNFMDKEEVKEKILKAIRN